MSKNIRILIADDNQKMVDMLKGLLQVQDDMQIVGEANNGLEAFEMIKETKPDVVLLDMVMPQCDGFGVRERI